MRFNQYFTSEEFECSCGECELIEIAPELIEVLTDIREHFGAPVTVSSAYRCLEYNRSVGSNDRSQHPKGTAADIWVSGVEHEEVQEYLLAKYPDDHGIGRYNTFTHIDVRGRKARWDNR